MWIPIDDLKTWEDNYNQGDIGAIIISVQRFGFNKALRIWRDHTIMAGNHSWLALQELRRMKWQPFGTGIRLSPENDGGWEVDCHVLEHLDYESARAFAIADNRTAECASHDDQQLAALLQDIAAQDAGLLTAVGYDADDLDILLRDLGMAEEPPGDPGAAMDRAAELQAKWQVERGQVWQVGRHRVMCGNAYDETHIAQLLDGVSPGMLHTDPPYGINIVQPRNGNSTAAIGGAKPFGSTSGAKRKTGIAFRNARAGYGYVQHGTPSRNQIVQSNLYPVIEGDDTPFDPLLFVDFAPIVIMWGANYYADKLPPSSGWIVWDKREGITRNTFADCEMAWTNQDCPARLFHHLWNGLHKGSQHGERRLHPTEKPVALFEEIGHMYCEGGIWVDLFAGVCSQVVAAERSGAQCFALEYEPMYVAVSLERLAGMGLVPELISGSRSKLTSERQIPIDNDHL
jgi:site-specific DNA-methyltransferase (adenine-specific)/modification methylase